MPIPAEIIALVERLNRDLNEIEQEAIQGLNRARAKLSRFPDNTSLIQIFASLNNALLFVEISRRQVQAAINTISPTTVSLEAVQEVGEDLAALLGRVLETKMLVSRILTRLENIP